jgi:lycopene beta-cyclase
MVYDVVLVGGGLSATLALLALHTHKPGTSVALIERAATLGGNHTWCFHARDVPESARAWVEPLVVQRWPAYHVRFPRRVRRLNSAYACVTSERLHQVVSERCAGRREIDLRLGTKAVAVQAHSVRLADGSLVQGQLVIDARGPRRGAAGGCQKFVGLELEVEPQHTLTEPIVMDATLPQRDGLRFMYVLPLSAERVLVEDTYFSESWTLDAAGLEREVLAYAAQLGLCVRGVVRREQGILPMPSEGAAPSVTTSPVAAGYGAGYFHPTTGYSFPLAVRFAEALAQSRTDALAASPLAHFAAAHAAQLPFLLRLTRVMFSWFAPAQRYAVLEHFYRLPEDVVERFYAAQLTPLDKLRLFMPPLPHGLSFSRLMGLPQGAAT